MSIPGLIAHRGFAARFPENTLLSLEQALKSGARYIEFDVQFCADGTAVLHHDASLERTTGIKINLFDQSYESIKSIQVSETARFGTRFVNMTIGVPTLTQAIDLLKDWPDVTVFVDVKKESLNFFGIEPLIKKILKIVNPVSKRCCILSRELMAVQCARDLGALSTGWTLSEWSDTSLKKATKFAPDYLFCNHKMIPSPTTLIWSGRWQWAIYEVIHPKFALALHARGIDLIETMDIGNMLAHPLFQGGNPIDRSLL